MKHIHKLFLAFSFFCALSATINDDLIQATQTGNIFQVRQLICQGALIHLRKDTAITQCDYPTIISLLKLCLHPDFESFRNNPYIYIKDATTVDPNLLMLWATISNRIDIVITLLIKYPRTIDASHTTKELGTMTALMYAAMFGFKDIVEMLIHKNAQINVQNSEHNDARNLSKIYGHHELDEQLTAHNQKNLAYQLIKASAIGQLTEVSQLLEQGADINAWVFPETSALAQAVKNDHVNVARFLLEHGVRAQTALTLQVVPHIGSSEMVLLLLEHGAQIHDWTLKDAAENGNLAVVQCLLEHGFNPGIWAIRYAAKNGHLKIVECLIEHGAHADDYALQWATDNNHLMIVSLLKHRTQT